MKAGVAVAAQARDEWWEGIGGDTNALGRRRPLVAASVGPYGASLANGSEYTGDYGRDMTAALLSEWHDRRLSVLAACPGTDVLACETLPSLMEMEALVRSLHKVPQRGQGRGKASHHAMIPSQAHLGSGLGLGLATMP